MDLQRVLQKYFSFSQFRPGQEEVIKSVLANNDTLALLPTGTGKSLCYQLPGYLMDGKIIIVSPLLSLMQDQVEQMKARGEKRVVALNSFLTFEERKFVIRNIQAYKFIYISPEMLQNEEITRLFATMNISLLVIDEAHCISQWGYDFRPDYLELGDIREKLGNPPLLALTATAREEVRFDIIRILKMKNTKQFINSADRPNIAMKIDIVNSQKQKDERILEYVKSLQPPGIIYFSSKSLADEWAQLLYEEANVKAASYHAGMEQEQRILLQQQFIYDEIDVMCATSAFGMGVNKENIRYVIHYHAPVDIESYLQEIGRAGRDGQNSIAILVYCNDDYRFQQQLIESELPTEEQIKYFSKIMNEKIATHGLEKIQQQTNLRKNPPIDGFSDIHWRLLLKSYFNLEKNIDFITYMKNFTMERFRLKQSRLSELTSWIYRQGCRRENILQLLNEKPEVKIDSCCDSCGINMELYLYKFRLQKVQQKLDWQGRLQAIFKSN